MPPIEYERHDHLGAFFGEAMCNTCRTSAGNKTLVVIHKGYEGEGQELTDAEAEKIRRVAEKHEHPSRVIFGHAYKIGADGNSLTIYSSKK